MIRLGFAGADITPEKPAELVGFHREDNLSRGVLKPLAAQVSVWEAGERCCLIAIDSIGFTKELTNELRNRVHGILDIPAEKVMICFSHTGRSGRGPGRGKHGPGISRPGERESGHRREPAKSVG